MKILLIRTVMWEHYTASRPFYELTDFMSASTLPPLGLLYLGAILEHEGHQVEIIDFYKEKNAIEQLKQSMKSSDLIGITVNYSDYKTVADLSGIIKELDPNIPLIIGGPHCTFFQHRSLDSLPDADISVVGEGERVILDIIQYLQGKKKLSDIPGIYYRKNKQIHKGKTLEIVHDLDSLLFPARHLVDKYDYGKVNGHDLFKPKLTSMVTSKGCPFKCRFCSRYGNFIEGWGVRERSAENVLNEFLEIEEKYGSVFITDDNFLANKKRAYKIMDGLIMNKTKIELLIEGARVDSADRNLYKKMKKANVKLIGFGIESGNQDVLDFYHKRFTLDQARRALQLSREMEFITMATFILGAPIETKRHLEQTIEFACSLPLDIAFFGHLYYVMWSPLWLEAVKANIISKDEYSVSADLNRDLGNFTPEELVKYTKIASRRFYMRPHFMFGQIYRAFLRKDFKLLSNGLDVIKTFRKEKLNEIIS